MKTFLSQLRDPKYIGQEGMREQAAFTIETLMAERDNALKQLEKLHLAAEAVCAWDWSDDNCKAALHDVEELRKLTDDHGAEKC